jgi:transcriptional regulator with XRE-family HTH domain
MPAATDSPLGTYLRDRRARLDPAALGFPLARRRTPGLRREEVAQRAHVSPTWYTWLEQGRGGAPSAEVLDRIAHALMLTEVEREHIYLLGLGRPPEARYPAMTEGVTPRLQRLLDALECSPALVRTSTWDVVAWNHAANVVLTDYAKIAPAQRNVLRLMFGSDRVRAAQPDWLGVARFVVAAFRADVARAGATAHAQALIDDLLRSSRVRRDLAVARRDQPRRRHQAADPRRCRSAGAGIFRLHRRRSTRSQHGRLQPRHRRGSREDSQLAATGEKVAPCQDGVTWFWIMPP